MAKIFISLGSNLGDKYKTFEKAFHFLEMLFQPTTRSSLYESKPLYDQNQDIFLNAVVQGFTTTSPLDTLNLLLDFETTLGRTRDPNRPKGPRTLDLDLLLYDNEEINSPRLVLPHKGILEREFVLKPLVEIAPDLIHFPSGSPYSLYLERLPAQGVYLIRES